MKRRSLFASLLASIPGLAFTAAPEPARQNKVYWLVQNYQGTLQNLYNISGPYSSREQALRLKMYYEKFEKTHGMYGPGRNFYSISEEVIT